MLTARKAGKPQVEFLTFSLSDVLVSAYQTGGAEGEVVPMDSVSLNFSKIQMEYKQQKAGRHARHVDQGRLGRASRTKRSERLP